MFGRLAIGQFWKSIRRPIIQAPIKAGYFKVCLISLIVTAGVAGLQKSVILQPLELRGYDWILRSRPVLGEDPRLLVVEFNEADLQRLNRVTPDDETLAKVLQLLQQHQPRVIGLDLYRDIPQAPGTEALHKQLQAINLVAITQIGLNKQVKIPAPEAVSIERVGFNNLLIDPDNVVRRNLLVADDLPSFSLLVGLMYLEKQGIHSQPAGPNQDRLKLGQTVLHPLQGNDAGYEQSDARGYQILLNYRAPGIAARYVSFTQLLENQVPKDWIRDKAVLIGNTSISAKDFFYTPFSAIAQDTTQTSGVELHAQMVSHIISLGLQEQRLIQTLPEWSEYLWMGIWSILAGGIAWKVRQPTHLLISGILCMSLLPIIVLGLFVSNAIWLPIVAPFLTALFTSGVIVADRAHQFQKQNRTVMFLLGQNTSKEIAAALWHNREQLLRSGKLPGQSLTATMLFTDLQGFSSISEQLSPEDLMDWLSEYLSAMAEVIHRHHGIVNKFTGDGLFAVFGVPIARKTDTEIALDAFNAVSCGLEMGNRLAELNQQWLNQGLNTVKMRVGICTGPVVAGSLGGRQRLEYGVIGDTVNTASRLESCIKDQQPGLCRVLISASTYRHIQPYFEAENWGQIPLKGKQNLVNVYHIIRRHQDEIVDVT